MVFVQSLADGNAQNGGEDHSHSGVENRGGQLIGYGNKTCFVGKALDEFTMEEFKSCSDIIEEDIYKAIDLTTCVNDRKIIGGPAKEAVEYAIAVNKKWLG